MLEVFFVNILERFGGVLVVFCAEGRRGEGEVMRVFGVDCGDDVCVVLEFVEVEIGCCDC